MKTNSHSSLLLPKMTVWVACFMLVLLVNKTIASGVPVVPKLSEKVAIIFKHNTEKDELTIRVKSSAAATMQLFIFSSDGILIEEVAVSANKTTTVCGLLKGYYLFECFDKDERMKSGSLLIK